MQRIVKWNQGYAWQTNAGRAHLDGGDRPNPNDLEHGAVF
jgi:hypothetical protein